MTHRPLHCRRPAAAREGVSGFTLIEVMIAIAIAGVTTAGLYGLFTMQSRQLLTQDLQMEMNQNLRFSTDMLSRSIRMAGYGTGGYVAGVLGPTNPGNSSQDSLLPVIIPWDANGANGTDALTVVYGDPALVMDSSSDTIEPCSTTSISFRPTMLDNAAKLAQYQAGDLLMCFDYADMRGMETYLWTVTSVNAASGVIAVSDNSGLSDYANVCSSGENLTPVMTCSKANVYTFYVDDDDGDGAGPGSAEHPVLMLDMDMSWPDSTDVPLVDDIEDLQLQYCLAPATGGSVDCTFASNWVDGSAITPSTDADRVWMVRVGLIARSSRQEFSDRIPGARPGLANHVGAAAGTDHYYRQVLSTEVSVRNIRYQANL